MIDIFVSEDILALFQVLGSARDSRAGEGAPAFANSIPTIRRGRRNEDARAPFGDRSGQAVRSPENHERDLLALFRQTGALLDGHFVLRYGLHSRQYFQCALLLQHTEIAEKVCGWLADKLQNFASDAVISLP
jgi:hypothetical protein